ncbi:MAG: MerR family transcriptional regulator [Actinomycetota bacterium]|nr:MerR family transcriptional regulator [Actinomycetota bacterium]
MSTVRTNAAAVMLGVSPNTLRSWERRFDYPRPSRTDGGHRQFDLAQLEALKQAFAETQDIASAISLARDRGEGPSTAARLRATLAAFDEERSARLLEESLAIRSLERTVEEILLPAVDALACRETSTAEHQFAWRFASGWMAAAQRLAPAPHRPDAVLLLEAARTFDLDALHVQALELALRRSGLRTLWLSVEVDPARVSRALRAVAPRAVVLTGRRAAMDRFGRLVYASRRAVHPVEVFDYRGALPDTGASTVCRLGDSPLGARDRLLHVLAQPAKAPAPAGPPAAPLRLRPVKTA